MADPLPPIPAPPPNASWREQFDYAVALQRHDDMQRQTAVIQAQVDAAIDATRALREATAVAAASPTDKDRWWALIQDAYHQDKDGIWRVLVGTDRLAQWANEAVQKSRALFPEPAPAPAP